MLLDRLIKVDDIITRHPMFNQSFKRRYVTEVKKRTWEEMEERAWVGR